MSNQAAFTMRGRNPDVLTCISNLSNDEDASLRYTGIESHPGLTHYGLYNTVVAKN